MNPDLTERIKACIKRYPAKKDHEIAKCMRGVRAADVAAARSGTTSTKDTSDSGMTLSVFRQQNDVLWKIRNGVKKYLTGETIMTDAEFRERLAANTARWRIFAENTEFAKYRMIHRGTTYWASERTIREMKTITGQGE